MTDKEARTKNMVDPKVLKSLTFNMEMLCYGQDNRSNNDG